jgi:ribosomal protein S13
MKRKLILTESQYNRIFNSKKRKLVITESQYKRLLSEIELKNNLVGGDMLKVTLKSDVEQILKIVDGFSDQIFMIDCNNAINKNYIYKLIDYSEENLKINTLRVHIKHINDIKKFKNSISDKTIWKPYAFNLLKEPEILKDKADEYKCTLDDVINVYKNPETEDDDNVSDKPDVKDGDMKVDIVKRLKSDIFNVLDKNEWVRIEFSDGSYVNVKIIDKQGSNVIIEFDEKDGVIKTYKGKAEEFVKPIRQFLQKLNKFNTISIDINKMTNFEKKINEQEVDDSDLKFDVPISITYNIDDNDEVKKFPLNNVYGINKTSKKEDSEDEDMSDEEFREYIKNDEFIKNIVLKKPGLLARLLGNYRGKGLKAAEDAIRKFKTDIKSKKDTGDYPGKEFETGKIITGQLTQFNDLITIYENFKLKVGKLNISKDSKIKLWSNINNDSYDINGNNAKYKFLIGKKIEDNLYRVEILERKEKTNEKRKIINSTLKIIDYGKKK